MKKVLMLLLCTSLFMGMTGCGKISTSMEYEVSNEEIEEGSSKSSETENDKETEITTEAQDVQAEEGELVELIEKTGPTESGTTADNTTWYAFENVFSEDHRAPIPAKNSLNAEEVYGKITYEPEMFYGIYSMSYVEDGELKTPNNPCSSFLDTCEWVDYEEVFGEEDFFADKITTIPHYMVAGYGSVAWDALLTLTEYDWCQLYFASKDENGELNYVNKMADYSISGNTITYHLLDNYYYDRATETLSYEFSDVYLTYEFEFQGPKLILRNETQSVELYSNQFCHNNSNFLYIDMVEIKVSEGCDGIDNIQSISFSHENYDEWDQFVVFVDEGGSAPVEYSGSLRISEDGLFSFSYKDSRGKVHAYEYVAFYCDMDGMIFTDGVNNYYYLNTFFKDYTDKKLDEMNVNISEKDKEVLENMTDEQKETINNKRAKLFADLLAAFEANNIAATVDSKTGEISLDAEVLFAVNESDLSEEGKTVVNAFIGAFMSVLTDPEYDGFISEIVVEGHTDTSGDYNYNLELSQKRADVVRDYCINDASLETESVSMLTDMLVAKGCSCDEPIYTASGEVDMDASRRVSFVFYIDLSTFQ